MTDKSKLTPMMRQYWSIKEDYPDAILFYRLGDFYEMFYEDAIEAARILEITLTTRDKNADNPIPMAGVPHHSAKDYIRRLIEADKKVAICEQMEDPATTKGMVDRQVVRVITPGTIIEDEALASRSNNYIAAIIYANSLYQLAYTDISTGEVKLSATADYMRLLSEIQGLDIREIIYEEAVAEADWVQQVQADYPAYYSAYTNSEPDKQEAWLFPQAKEGQVRVLNLLFAYLYEMQKQDMPHMQEVEYYDMTSYLQMNYYTKAQLELTRSLRSSRRKGSLLALLDKTKTAMGARKLQQWLDKPLLDKAQLSDRHDKVGQLLTAYFERIDLQAALEEVYDLERLVTKVSMGTANARDINQLKQSLQQVPAINQLLTKINEFDELVTNTHFDLMDECSDIVALIDQVLVDEPPISISEGDLIKDGYSQLLDQYRDTLNHGQEWLADLQLREREATGLKTLKIGYNKVFGYYIEVSRKQADLLEEGRYERKQTLANTERYISPELKEIEQTILDAQEKSTSLEYELFVQLRQDLAQYTGRLQDLASQIAELDVLCNFAAISESEGYQRADISSDPHDFYLKDSRHPVVEQIVGPTNFVANDLETSQEEYILLLTGPNMSGKSTYMRQIAYCVILNQIGCFVPAKEARLPLVDKIFTRIGSADDISSGQSTFMVEMMETNQALQEASPRSLLLFDEIGRGTATFDGMALAGAILKYIAEEVQATSIFSTHYHELTDLADEIDVLKNIHVGAKEYKGELIFLYKILQGPADKSYGIQVAKLAGLPDSLIQTSQAILEELEKHSHQISYPGISQIDLFEMALEDLEEDKQAGQAYQGLVDQLKDADLNQMTPLEAMLFLQDIQAQIQGIEEG